MKFKSLLFIGCFSLFTSAFANNMHLHPKANSTVEGKAPTKRLMDPGSCEIEVSNRSYDNVTVFGRFDDGTAMKPFPIYSKGYDSPHYISLYYYGYCHAWMDLFIDTFSKYNVFTGYQVPVQSIIQVVPYLKKLKVEISSK